ncbi:probable chitinase 10 [Anopheles darlingi]|uniref:probable chitinase 10 n=1 Tax=Anopheles darlingi TaxID=43151 RepID=UPI0021003F43|nr:probable chitinase 10 [Anopheles darlingi]
MELHEQNEAQQQWLISSVKPVKPVCVRISRWTLWQLCIVVIGVLLLGGTSTSGSSQRRLVCYFTNWSPNRPAEFAYAIEDIPLDLCTHVTYYAAGVDAQNYELKTGNAGYDILQDGFKKFGDLKRIKPNLRLSLTVACEESACGPFEMMAASLIRRQKFITSTMQFMKRYGFDGIEIGWIWPGEGPERGADKDNLYHLINELKRSFKEAGFGWEVAVFVPMKRSKIEQGFHQQLICQAADYVHLTGYEIREDCKTFADVHSPMNNRAFDQGEFLDANVKGGVQHWIAAGCPAEKIVLEVAMYGRSYTLANETDHKVGAPITGPGDRGQYTGTSKYKAYFEICTDFKSPGWTVDWDVQGMCPYAYNGNQWVGFENENSVTEKAVYAATTGLAGIYAYPIDVDDYKGVCGKKYPLLNALRDAYQPSIESAVSVVEEEDDSTSLTTTKIGNIIMELHEQNEAQQQWLISSVKPVKPVYVRTAIASRWSLWRLCVVVIGVLLLGGTTASSSRRRRLVCYFTNWSPNRPAEFAYGIDDIPAELCTHVTYYTAGVDAQNYELKTDNARYDILQDGFKKFANLKRTQPDLRLSLAVACEGAACGPFEMMASSLIRRQKFITSAMQFMQRYGFDGIEIGWIWPGEGPERSADKDNLYHLINELKRSFKEAGHGWEVAVFVPMKRNKIEQGFHQQLICQAADYVHLTGYDIRGNWNTFADVHSPMNNRAFDQGEFLDANVKGGVQHWIAAGCPAEKIVLEVAMYGRSYTLANETDHDLAAPVTGPGQNGQYTGSSNYKAYFEICNELKNPGWTIDWDVQGMCPYAYNGNQWVGFENENSVTEKAVYAATAGLAGLYAYPIDVDDYKGVCGKKYPLLNALRDAYKPERAPVIGEDDFMFAIWRSRRAAPTIINA